MTESFFQRAVTPSQCELISHHFHQHCSHRILGRISDSQTRPSPFLGQSNHYFACCWHCSFFRGSLGPITDCFSFVGPWVLVRGCFPLFTSIWYVFHQTYWYVFHQTFSCCLVLDFASHVTRLCFSSWSAGCVLRRRLLMSGSSCTPILGFGSRVFSRPRLFLLARLRVSGRHRPPRVTFAALWVTSLLFCSSSSILR